MSIWPDGITRLLTNYNSNVKSLNYSIGLRLQGSFETSEKVKLFRTFHVNNVDVNRLRKKNVDDFKRTH